MRKNNTPYFILLFTLFLLVTIVGCQSTQDSESNGADDVQNIQIQKNTTSQSSVIDTEEFPLPNCGGTSQLIQSLGTQASVSKHVELGITVSVEGGVEVGLSKIAALSLEGAVETAYKQEYDQANLRLDTIIMEALAKTHVVYIIEWEKIEFSSMATSEFNRELVQTPYKFTMNVPKLVDSRQVICATTTPTIAPPPPPSIEPPKCQAGTFCDDFTSLDTDTWCEVPSSGFSVTEGHFVIAATEDIQYNIHPCANLDKDIRFIELILMIDKTSGVPGNAHAGIGASFSQDGYFNFYIDSAKNAVVEHGNSTTPNSVDETVPIDDISAPHTLRVEWTDTEVIFFLDGKQLDTKISSTNNGSWFLLSGRAYPGSKITVEFDSIQWGN